MAGIVPGLIKKAVRRKGKELLTDTGKMIVKKAVPTTQDKWSMIKGLKGFANKYLKDPQSIEGHEIFMGNIKALTKHEPGTMGYDKSKNAIKKLLRQVSSQMQGYTEEMETADLLKKLK